jgi:hypothetical protein
MIPVEDIFNNSLETTHANVGALLYGLRDTVDQLIAIRVRDHGSLLDGEFAEIMAIKQNLDFLLSDIQANLKVAAHGKA